MPDGGERIARWSVVSSRNMIVVLGGDMENFFLFVLSSSFCTLVTGVTLLLRPLLGLP